MTDISLIILTSNQKELTLRCLRSLKPFIENPRYETILVDNGSVDGTADDVREQFPSVRIVSMSRNMGVAAGRNAGLGIAVGRHLMILDNDTIADAATIESLSKYLDTNSDVGLVAPALYSPEGALQNSFKPFPGLWNKIRNVCCTGNDTAELPAQPIEPFYVIGAAQMFPAEVYNRAGGLDENIFYGPEDADFCMAVRKLGKRVVYNPNYKIIHDWQRVTNKNIFSRIARKHFFALLYFYNKHKRCF